jgi:thiol-disulfide isomerase/thioredoxin
MCEEILRCTRESIANSSKDLEHVEDIAPEALFQAIIAPHKGKVILVDFWNTWCGPCRKAIKEIKPHKTGQLSSDDLVWVYIANGTSPIGTYSNMITGIKGVHYRVSDAQWDYLTSKLFDIDGIPSYVLVKKDGTFSLRNDLHDINKMVTVLKEELEKE